MNERTAESPQDSEPILTPETAQRVLMAAGVPGPVTVEEVRTNNHVWRLRVAEQSFFLKTHTKHWYGGDLVSAGGAVAHEAAAYGVLTAHGLPSPLVVAAVRGTTNPFWSPFPADERAARCPTDEVV